MLKRILYNYFFIIFLSVCALANAQAQFQNESFGKNRVQTKVFKWQFISTQNFDVYFYDGGRDLANYAARYAEQNFDRVCNVVGFSPYSKVKLMVYTSVSDAQQSNIGLDDPDMQVGGNTNFVKSKVELPFRGTRAQFNKDIDKGVTDVIINVMMYGGNLKDVIQSSFLLALPDWYLEGATRYISEGWSIEMDDYMRDLMRRKHVKKPSLMEGRQAHIVGQSIWNYIAKKYGEDNMANILNLTRIIRDEKESIENTLNIPYNIFLEEWQEYYRSMGNKIEDSYAAAPEENRIKKNKKKHFDFRNLSISPDGSLLAYSQSYKGKYKIIVADSNGRNSRAIVRGGYHLINQPDNRNIPIVAWQSQKRVAFISTKGYKSYLNIYTFRNRKFYEIYKKRKVKILLDDVREVLSMNFSLDGKFIVMSAVRKTQSDIFIYDVYSDKLTQVTNDVYDDLTPQFVDNTKSVVFSSNRYIDSTTKTRDRIFSHNTKFNILRFTPTDSVRRFEKYTGEGNNYLPMKVEDGILFLSDRTGILNLFKVTEDGSMIKQVTNYSNNMNYYSLNKDTKNLAFIMLDEGRENIYHVNDFNYNRSLPPTPLTDRALFFNKGDKKKSAVVKKNNDDLDESDININVFQFESEKKKKRKKKSEEIKKEPVKIEFKSVGPYKSKPLFSFDRLISTIRIEPLRGLGIFLNPSMSDMFGNHKLNTGVVFFTDFKSNTVFAEYQYLKHRVDFSSRFDRSTFNFYSEQAQQQYTINNFHVTASLPLTVFDRISFSPLLTQTRYNEIPTPSTNIGAVTSKDSTRIYGGYKLEYVHDHTEVTGMNMLVGSRWKICYETYVNPKNKLNNFGKIYFDFRHYQRVHKEIIFATRISGGAFIGKAQKNYFLGGMDNWLFQNKKNYPNNDPISILPFQDNSNLLFSPFVTNIRGFDYNAAYGPKYLLLNAELRIPLIRYLYNGPITSNFFRNLQLTAFTDVGSAWSGTSPFTQNNKINKEIKGNDLYTAEVTNYTSPWLIGYGGGLRTLFLGYYAKVDVGWGILDYQVQKPKIYLSIGYDF